MTNNTHHPSSKFVAQIAPEEAIAHLYGLLNTMQEAIITMNLPDRRLIFVNASFEKVFGYPADQFLSDKNFFKAIIPPDDLDFVIQKQAECLREGYVELDHRIILPSGEIRWLHRRAWVNYDDNHKPIQMNDSARDITEYRKSREELAQREANLRILFNTINDFLYVLDMQGNIKEVNHTVIERLGYTADELIGKSVLMLHPESTRAQGQEILDAMLRGEREYCPLPLQTKLGDIIFAESHVTHGTWNGEPALFDVVKDISPLKHSEEKFSTAFHANPAIAGVSEIETGEYIDINQAFCDKLGFTREEVIGKRAVDILHLDPIYRARVISKLKENNVLQNEEAVIYTKDGKPLLVLLSAQTITLHDKVYNFTTAIDITERVEAEKALRASEQKFVTAFHANPSMATLTDATTGIFVDVNEAFYKRMGFVPADVIGKTAAETIGLDRTQLTEQMQKNGFVRDVESVIYTKTGEPVYVLLSAQLFKADDKTYALTTAIDMTERRKAEQALRESEEKYRSLINSSDAAITMVDADGRYLFLNRIASIPYNAPPEALVGKTVPELFQKDEADQILRDVRHVISRNAGMVLEPHVVIEGETRWFRTSIQPVSDATGKPYAAMIHATEITAKKLVEQEILIQNKVLHQAHDLISFCDTKSDILFINQAGVTLMGYDNAQEMSGVTIPDFHTPEDAQKVVDEYLPRAIANGFWRGENRLKTRDGTLIDVDQTIFPIYGVNGEVIRVATIMMDIRDKKQIQRLLEQANSQLEARVMERTAELERAKERIEAIFNYSGDAIVLLDLQHGIQQTNFAFHKMFNTDSDGAFSTRLRDWIVDEYQSEVYEALQNVAKTRHMQHIEAKGKTRNNIEFDVEMSLAPIHHDEMGVSDLVCIIRDISLRKQAEVEEHEMQGYLKRLHEITLDLTRTETLDDFYRHVVEQGLSQFGFDRMGLLLYENGGARGTYGTNPQGAIVNEADLYYSPDQLSPYMRQTLQTQDHIVFWEDTEHIFYRKVFARGQRMLASLWNTDPLGWISVDNAVHEKPFTKAQRDIFTLYALTVGHLLARKQAEFALRDSEEPYRFLAENIKDVIIKISPDGKFTFVTPSSYDLSNHYPHELIGHSVTEFIHPDDIEDALTGILDAVMGGDTFFTIKQRLIHKEGYYIWVEVTNTIVRDPKTNQAIEIIGIIHDITERVAAEELLKQTIEQEKELIDLKSRFVTMASHEFRTPLASILATTETLTIYRGKMDDNQINTRLDKIRQQVVHMRDIMEDVLQWAKVQAGRMEFSPTQGDLDMLCREIIEEFDIQEAYHGRIIYHHNNLQSYSDYDVRLMRQIISNLVSNALKYSPNRQPIFISLSLYNNQAVLSVTDTGIGIPESDVKRLFEPFHRAANVGTISGTGLGLSITHQAVQLHGGKILVNSEVGKGTTFTVIIPTQSPKDTSTDDKDISR